MKTTWLFLLALVLFHCYSSLAVAQSERVPISVTIDSYKSIQKLPSPGWMIKEGKTPLSIHDILKGDIKDGQVVTLNPDEIVIQRFGKYWFAIEFISKVDLHNWLLHVESPFTRFGYSSNFSEMRSYHIQDGQLVNTGITGAFVPASQRDFASRHTQSLLNLNLSSGSSVTLWVQITKNRKFTSTFPHLILYDPLVALPDFTIGAGLFWIGTILMAWILALIILLYLKDRTSTWFFVFVTALIIDTLSNAATDPLTSLLYPEYPELGLHVGFGTSVLMMTSLLQFARVLIDLRSKNRKLDKIVYVSVWFFMVSSFVLFYLYYYNDNIKFLTIFRRIFGITFLASGTAYFFFKDPLARIIGVALLLFVIPNLIPLPFGETFLSISALLLTATIGVAYRIKILFQERLRAEAEKKDLLVHQNLLLEKQVDERTAALNQSLHQLRATQSQLIMQEKMASLGELTAGIAHEIQNPLNFVNNFSEVSQELLHDMKEELTNGSKEEAIAIANDVSQNLEKIHHHGQRADAIVKGMLQHSRSSNGQKELTDLNALADEYLRLAYHGLRAKDKSFNCTLDTRFDAQLELVKVVPQDVGQVLLNLYNNALFAVQQKQKQMLELAGERWEEEPVYVPTVSVSTYQQHGQVELRVRDNGTGIPEAIKAKIFQPFFTTKPTGQGTGLGLSLSYDIITKGHGGELVLETEPGCFTELIIRIPLEIHT
jgi:signal transduction histidine kinase